MYIQDKLNFRFIGTLRQEIFSCISLVHFPQLLDILIDSQNICHIAASPYIWKYS